jgi:hypothetical protein
MRKQTPLRIAIIVALGAWLLVAWATQPSVNASQTTTMPLAVPQEEPLQQHL